MEQLVLPEPIVKSFYRNNITDLIGLEVRHSSGFLRTEITIQEGIESMLTVYSITGQIRLKKRILNSGHHEFDMDIIKGEYVATLVSGKLWAAKRVVIN